jgi:hypothetical protein
MNLRKVGQECLLLGPPSSWQFRSLINVHEGATFSFCSA